MEEPEAVPFARPTESFALSSLLHTATPDELLAAGVAATDQPSLLIDDFSDGWRDWYVLSADNPHHWEFSTRKLADPKWRGAPGRQLAFDVQADEANELVVVLTENFFRPYRGAKREFVAVVKLTGDGEPQSAALTADDFIAGDQTTLTSWSHVDLLSFRAYFDDGERLWGSRSWAGRQPVFRSLRWERDGR